MIRRLCPSMQAERRWMSLDEALELREQRGMRGDYETRRGRGAPARRVP